MFYDGQKNDHGLPHDPFKAIISPRPIGWIGTRGRDGSINLAPYSYFNAVSDAPKIVMFSSNSRKDSLRNCEETGVFTASLVGLELAKAMNLTSVDAPYEESEFAYSGLKLAEAKLIDAPYVKDAAAAIECKVTEIIRPRTLDGGEASNWMIFGQVVGVHIADEAIKDGMFDTAGVAPVARLGYMDYSASNELFQMRRPIWGKD